LIDYKAEKWYVHLRRSVLVVCQAKNCEFEGK